MEVTVKDTAYEIRPGHDLKEAISLHGEDRVYALYLLYFIEKAKQAIRQRTSVRYGDCGGSCWWPSRSAIF